MDKLNMKNKIWAVYKITHRLVSITVENQSFCENWRKRV